MGASAPAWVSVVGRVTATKPDVRLDLGERSIGLDWRCDDGRPLPDGTVVGRKAVMGALTLYLDFINIFMFLLQQMGNRNSN